MVAIQREKAMSNDGEEFATLRNCVEGAINKIYTEEKYLIEHCLSEWTISAQFYYWMRNRAPKKLRNYDYDAEYNHMSLLKNKEAAKKVVCVDGAKFNVRPDFIIHNRGKSDGNILWAELKRHGGKDWLTDLSRVSAVTQKVQNDGGVEYITGYRYGLGVLFRKNFVRCEWFSNNRTVGVYDGIRSGKKMIWKYNI